MRTTERVMVGVFQSAGDAQRAIRDLRDAQFSPKQIGVLSHDRHGRPLLRSFRELEGNRAGAGAVVGAIIGAVLGALWALGVAGGLLPPIGPLVGAGLIGSLAATAAAGAGIGVILGTLVGLSITDEAAAYEDPELQRGRPILAVQPSGRDELVGTIFQGHGATIEEAPAAESLAERIEATHAPVLVTPQGMRSSS